MAAVGKITSETGLQTVGLTVTGMAGVWLAVPRPSADDRAGPATRAAAIQPAPAVTRAKLKRCDAREAYGRFLDVWALPIRTSRRCGERAERECTPPTRS
jgi:hypothetical protein